MTDKFYVVHTNMEKELFRPRLIAETIINETGINEELAKKIQNRITKKIYKLKKDGLEEISTSQIRAEVSAQLLQEKEFEAVEKNHILGMSVTEFETLLNEGCKDNANMDYNPEMISKYAYDSIAKQYALQDMPKDCADAHIEGYIHCLSANNDLIVKVDNIIQIKNIVDIIDSYEEIDYYVPSINPKTNIIEWKKIIYGVCTGKEKVYEIEFGKGYKIECTSDHKFLKYNSRENKISKNYNISIDDFDNYKSTNSIRFCSLNHIPYTENNNKYYESAFYGFFLGDGTINHKKIQFHLSKKDKIEYITTLLKQLNKEYKLKKYNTATVITCENFIEIKDKQTIPFELNYTGLLEGLINSDGYITQHGGLNTNYLEFDSTNKFITDLFFIACLTHNIRPSYQKIKTKNKKWSKIYRCVVQNNYVNDLLLKLNLREYHKQKITLKKSNSKVYETSGITPKKIKALGEQLVYNITVEDNHNFMAGTQGFILTQNCHDLEYFHTRPNCFNSDLRFYARNGLKIDGKGVMGSVAKPAKTLEVLLNHLLQAFMCGATVFSGGQGYVNFNTLLAPFAKGRDYKDIKQAIQGFIYNCNMSLVCRGGQILFSNLGIDLSCPDVLKDEPAVGPEGVVNGTYKDYQEEADLIFRALLEVSEEKDALGAYHRFPNLMFNIREGDLDEYTGNCKLLHEKGCNNPTLYYVNCKDMERTVMGALTSDTPVMTDKGFKYPSRLRIGDKVMTYAENGVKEWNKIYNIIPKVAPDKVFKITLDNNYQFKVTENHKLPTNKGIVKSEDLQVGMELYNYVDEAFIPVDDYESEFIGVFLADGHIRDKTRIKGRSSYFIEFHVKQEWKKDKIIELCTLNNYSYDVKLRKDNTYTICIREKELRNKLNSCYDSDGVKHFPSDVWGDKNSVANIIKGLMFDGRKGSKTRWDWSCSDLPLVIDVLYALSYIGRQSTIYVDNRNGDSGNWRTNYKISFGLNYTPRNTCKIKSIELVDNSDVVYDLSIENNPNYVCGLGGIHSENCRTALPVNYSGDYSKDSMNTGNFMYCTLNLPLIALKSEDNSIEKGTDLINEFYELLDYYCEIIYKTLIYRRECVIDTIYNKHMSDFLLQEDIETGEPLYDIDRTTVTIGFCGLYECLNVLGENDDFGVEILNYLNSKKEEFFNRDGLRWSVIASPAESASHRFATMIKEKYPDAEVQGVKGSYYLTNSSHIPVSDETNIIDHIRNASVYHPLTLGGNLLHLWNGEVWSDAKAIWSLNKKILDTGTIYWAYSKVFTHCPECGYTINDDLDVCPICGSKELYVYDRITGYYLCTKTFNNGKYQEFKDRYRHSFNELTDVELE